MNNSERKNIIFLIYQQIKKLKNMPLSNRSAYKQTVYDLYKDVNQISARLMQLFTAADFYSGYEKSIDNLRQQMKAFYKGYIKKPELINAYAEIVDMLIKNNQVTFEIVFMPYKASMWDAFDSIYRAAAEDPRCRCYVVPVPYYDRDHTGALSTIHCEQQGYPSYIYVENYTDFFQRHPEVDIIYYHNPYDGCNKVTSVMDKFYSNRLKELSLMQVYVPYYISGANFDDYKDEKFRYALPGIMNADVVIAQNDIMARLYEEAGVKADRIRVYGTPKIDYIFNRLPSNTVQKGFLADYVYLVNISLTDMLANGKGYLDKLTKQIEQLLSSAKSGVILRPHPLLRATISAMRPEMAEEYDRLIKLTEDYSQIIIDNNPDYTISFYLSNALISDRSSLIRAYIPTGKPVLSLTKETKYKYYAYDFFSLYYAEDYGGDWSEFAQIVESGKDDMKSLRLKNMKESIANADGSCGRTVHNEIVRMLLNGDIYEEKA